MPIIYAIHESLVDLSVVQEKNKPGVKLGGNEKPHGGGLPPHVLVTDEGARIPEGITMVSPPRKEAAGGVVNWLRRTFHK